MTGIRLSWTQPEDLLPHALVAAELEGRDVADLRDLWVRAGGAGVPPATGASPDPAPPELRRLAVDLLARVDQRPLPAALVRDEPDDMRSILALAPSGEPSQTGPVGREELRDRVHGAWLGRAVGCLLGKPVEKVPREGIRAIAQSTRNWPVRQYFTEIGLDPAVAAAYPWNRRSRSTSLAENITGMPEDDDLNFALVALRLLERFGPEFTTDDVATVWLEDLPGGRVFTAERVAYRNLLSGIEPDQAGHVKNPFVEWIGAQIRADVYGWASPGDPVHAATMAWADGRLTHARSGLYGALFVAAACSQAVVGNSVDDVIRAGLSVVPAGSRYAVAVRRGVDIGRSGLEVEEALDVLHAELGHLHWVHVLNNAALVAFALTRSGGDFDEAIGLAVMGGWDTDSDGATVGSICGALAGAGGLGEQWVGPLAGRLATSLPGFDGARFDQLAARTVALAPSRAGSSTP